MPHTSILSRDNYTTYPEVYKSALKEREDLAEINEEASTRFFLFQEQGLFNWEFFHNELEYE